MGPMPIPSANEMTPSDGFVGTLGRVWLGAMLTVVAGGLVSGAIVILPASFVDVLLSALMGAGIGLVLSLPIGPITGIAAGLGRALVRRSPRHAVAAGLLGWLVWTGVMVLAAKWLNYPVTSWRAVWPFLPAVAVGLVGALLVSKKVYDTEDPPTPEEIRAAQRRGRVRR